MSDSNDFVIKDGLLTSYLGKEQRVVIPDGVTHVRKHVFTYNHNITEVVFPDSLQSIDEDAFRLCTKLKRVNIPNGVTKIGSDAFKGCSSLKEIEIPAGVREIERRVFSGCTELEQVKLPDGLKKIDSSAFERCVHLQRVNFPDSISEIGFAAFSHCESLAEISLPESLNTIDCFAFSSCAGHTDICIPAGVNKIGESAFYGWSALEKITILGRTKEVDKDIFQNCPNIRELNFYDAEFVIKADFFGQDIPEGVRPLIGSLFSHMSDGALKQYVLKHDLWQSLPMEKKLEIFLTKQGKSLLPAYAQCINQQEAEHIGQHICSLLSGKASTKECNMVANFLILFVNSIPRALTQNIYDCLTNQKNAAKALQTINASIDVVNTINS